MRKSHNLDSGFRRNDGIEPGMTVQPPEAAIGYAADGDTIFIQTGKRVLDGEEIAPGIVVLYDAEDGNNVVGITIIGAEGVLKPFVDAILTKYGAAGSRAGEKISHDR